MLLSEHKYLLYCGEINQLMYQHVSQVIVSMICENFFKAYISGENIILK